jgi:hypothetical protein
MVFFFFACLARATHTNQTTMRGLLAEHASVQDAHQAFVKDTVINLISSKIMEASLCKQDVTKSSYEAQGPWKFFCRFAQDKT